MQPDYQSVNPANVDVSIQNRVLRNTYMLLGITMIPTILGALIGTHMDFTWAMGSRWLFPLVFLGGAWGLMFAIQATRNSSMSVVLLLALTGFMGWALGPILQYALHLSNGIEIITLAAGGTSIIFLSLATIASTTKRDFSFMGKFLFVGLILVFVAMLANIFFQIPAFSLAISGVAVLLFSGYILYDVSRIVHGGETNYVMATLKLYLDIYNLFVHLLNILMAVLGNRR
ncbi:MAG: Bax inhibitor-1/YccA family protein [Methylobacillus sp.]|jgi:modulator of FtsH protease|nr:Bax inhibitor-1/YccA family protein [Methylobacillus sp.]